MQTLGIDLDGTAIRFHKFFSTLSEVWPGKVYIVTARDDLQSVINDCTKYQIKYDEIVLADFDDSKAQHIKRLGIDIMFDDTLEFSRHFPEECTTFHVRNEDNFNFDTKQYIFSEDTGRGGFLFEDDKVFLEDMLNEFCRSIIFAIGTRKDKLYRFTKLLKQLIHAHER